LKQVNLEHLVLRLPLHLLACVASGGVEPRLRYLLRGVRLLHSLSDLAVRHPKLEQVIDFWFFLWKLELSIKASLTSETFQFFNIRALGVNVNYILCMDYAHTW
jgi:hypothetical protein